MRPEAFSSILGTTFVRNGAETILQIGKEKRFDRYQLAALGVPQIKAARHLDLICQRLSIRTFAQLAARIGELPAIRGVGHAAFYVALAVLAAEGYDRRALANYADIATSRVHHNPADPEFTPVPVMLATLKRRTRPITLKGTK